MPPTSQSSPAARRPSPATSLGACGAAPVKLQRSVSSSSPVSASAGASLGAHRPQRDHAVGQPAGRQRREARRGSASPGSVAQPGEAGQVAAARGPAGVRAGRRAPRPTPSKRKPAASAVRTEARLRDVADAADPAHARARTPSRPAAGWPRRRSRARARPGRSSSRSSRVAGRAAARPSRPAARSPARRPRSRARCPSARPSWPNPVDELARVLARCTGRAARGTRASTRSCMIVDDRVGVVRPPAAAAAAASPVSSTSSSSTPRKRPTRASLPARSRTRTRPGAAPARTMACVVLAKILRAGEGKKVRRLSAIADHIETLEDDYVDLTDAELRALTDTFKERLRRRRDPRRPAARGVRRRARGRAPHAGPVPLQGAAHGRRRPAPRQRRRDEDR